MNALNTLWNVIVAPAAAFEELRGRSTWLVACIVTVALSLLAQTIMLPATLHAFAVWYPSQLGHDPRTAGMTAAQRQTALAVSLSFVRVGSLFAAVASLVAALATGVVLWMASLAWRGSAGFRVLFALSMNVAIIWFGLGQLVNAAIVSARGSDAFTTPWQLSLALPSAAWFAPAASPKVLGFLIGLNPFSLWSFLLLGAGTAALARIPPVAAYAASGVVMLCSCLLFAFAIQP